MVFPDHTHLLFKKKSWFYLGCNNTNNLYATNSHTTYSKKHVINEPKYTRNTMLYLVYNVNNINWVH